MKLSPPAPRLPHRVTDFKDLFLLNLPAAAVRSWCRGEKDDCLSQSLNLFYSKQSSTLLVRNSCKALCLNLLLLSYFISSTMQILIGNVVFSTSPATLLILIYKEECVSHPSL